MDLDRLREQWPSHSATDVVSISYHRDKYQSNIKYLKNKKLSAVDSCPILIKY